MVIGHIYVLDRGEPTSRQAHGGDKWPFFPSGRGTVNYRREK